MTKANKTKNKNDAESAAKDHEIAAANMMGGVGDLDQIRQILFGSQSQALAQQIKSLENLLGQELSALRKAIDKRLDALEAHLDNEVNTLNDRLTEEKQLRSDAESAIAEEAASLAGVVHENRVEMRSQIEETDKVLRSHFDAQATTAASDTDKRLAELTARLEEAVAGLNNAKTDRHNLADLFDTLSGQLRQDG